MSRHPRQGPLLWQAQLIQVIEKSAFDAVVKARDELAAQCATSAQAIDLLQAERDQARAEVERLSVNWNKWNVKEAEELCDRYRAALETIAAQHSGEIGSVKRSDCMAVIARQALDKALEET